MQLEHYIALQPLWKVFLVIPGAFLVNFLFQFFFGHKLRDKGTLIATALSGVAFGVSVFLYSVFGSLSAMPEKVWAHWIRFETSGNEIFSIDLSLFQDGTTALMLVLVTGITFLVHLFSIEYMRNEPLKHRYWAYLGLFAFSMCGLVMMSGLEFIFIFWELVGVSSYFLIGFWFTEEKPAAASQKAMIINRLGDIGFFAGLMILMGQFGYLNLGFLAENAGNGDPFWTSLAGVLILLGVFSKSAQFPFQVWLPDAMSGPTPASALIHAATMVVAGVYLLFRTLPFIGETALTLAAFVGGITAVMAAFSAITQTDIKKVLAYSTVSQLGFMILGLGVGAYKMAFLHLVTHAFFKAGLFLAAGAVIHAIHRMQHDAPENEHFDAQDIRWMGGLRKRMPLTFIFYMIMTAALIGLPFFSGFLSKDGILTGALGWAQGHPSGQALGFLGWLPALMGFLAALMTAFYMARHAILIFFGNSRLSLVVDKAEAAFDKIREVPPVMWIPMALLAAGSIGQIFAPGHLFAHATDDFWLLAGLPEYTASQLGFASEMAMAIAGVHFHSLAALISVVLAVCGIGLALLIYRNSKPGLDDTRTGLAKVSFSHFFLDELYERILAKGFLSFARITSWFDKRVVDGVVRFLSESFVGKEARPVSVAAAASGAERQPQGDSAEEFPGREESDGSISSALGWFDRNIVDGMVNRLGQFIFWMGGMVRKLQPGKVQLYIAATVSVLLVLLLYLIYFGG